MPRVVPAALPQDQLEVVARPADTFVQPRILNAAPQVASDMEQLSQALGSLSPEARRYSMSKVAEGSEEQTRAKLADLQSRAQGNQAGIAELVRSGDLDLGLNPWANRAAKQMLLRQTARKIGQEIESEYLTSPAQNYDPAAFDEWARERFDAKTKAVGFENGERDPDFIDSFMPTRDQLVAGLRAQHIAASARKNVEAQRDALQQEIADSADMATGDTLEAHADYIGRLTETAAIRNGMAPRDAYELTLKALVQKAVTSGDARYLDIAEKVPTEDGTGAIHDLGSRLWAQEALAVARGKVAGIAAGNAELAERREKKAIKLNDDRLMSVAASLYLKDGPELDAEVAALRTRASEMALKGEASPETVGNIGQALKAEMEFRKWSDENGVSHGDRRFNAGASQILRADITLGKWRDYGALASYINQHPDLMAFRNDILGDWEKQQGDAQNDAQSWGRQQLATVARTLDDPALKIEPEIRAQVVLALQQGMSSFLETNPTAPPFVGDGTGYMEQGTKLLENLAGFYRLDQLRKVNDLGEVRQQERDADAARSATQAQALKKDGAAVQAALGNIKAINFDVPMKPKLEGQAVQDRDTAAFKSHQDGVDASFKALDLLATVQGNPVAQRLISAAGTAAAQGFELTSMTDRHGFWANPQMAATFAQRFATRTYGDDIPAATVLRLAKAGVITMPKPVGANWKGEESMTYRILDRKRFITELVAEAQAEMQAFNQ